MGETVTGYIDHVIFRNDDNGYTVMVLKDTAQGEELTCVGIFPSITQGATIEAQGIIQIIRFMENSSRFLHLRKRCRRTVWLWNAIWAPAQSRV